MEHNEPARSEWSGDEPMDHELAEFERRLQAAMQRREAPLGLKARVLARSRAMARERREARQGRLWMLQRIAATAVLAALVSGFVVYRQVEERRKGEQAREQVMIALRITSKALNRAGDRVNQRADGEHTDATYGDRR